MTKTHKIIYWVSTTFVSLGMLGGGLAQLFRVKQNVDFISLRADFLVHYSTEPPVSSLFQVDQADNH